MKPPAAYSVLPESATGFAWECSEASFGATLGAAIAATFCETFGSKPVGWLVVVSNAAKRLRVTAGLPTETKPPPA